MQLHVREQENDVLIPVSSPVGLFLLNIHRAEREKGRGCEELELCCAVSGAAKLLDAGGEDWDEWL